MFRHVCSHRCESVCDSYMVFLSSTRIRPCHTIPGGPASAKEIEITDAHHPRIEGAFRKYFHRAPLPDDEKSGTEDEGGSEVATEKHEFEIIVCHANVIRYCMCRYEM